MPKKLLAKSSKKKKELGAFKSKSISKTKHRSASSNNPNRVIKGKKPHSYREKSTINLLNLYNDKPDEAERQARPKEAAKIEPDRRWFGNTRTIAQSELDSFRKEVKEVSSDPYSMLVKSSKLPMSLISEPLEKDKKPPLLDIETYQDTFGPKARRKRPKLLTFSLENLVQSAQSKNEDYDVQKDPNLVDEFGDRIEVRDKRLEAGQSRRIWEELYKVLDSSDVICQVLDVRNPIGTRCPHIEKQLKKQPNKHLIFILNKCDLVPTWVTTGWVKRLSSEYPTVAFHASVTNPFGKSALTQLVRQFDKFHRDKKNISIGFIGYPNVGKSSVINTLRAKAVCKVAPIPGETKVWQYIALTKRVYLIDCPGVVYDTGDSDQDLVLKGVVRPEKLEDAHIYIQGILDKVEKEHLKGIYGVQNWVDCEDFLTQLAKMGGRLLKGGEPDLNTVGKMILHDWQRGKILYYDAPPKDDVEMEGTEEVAEEVEGQ
jgi:nuclear GTP-binding protein